MFTVLVMSMYSLKLQSEYLAALIIDTLLYIIYDCVIVDQLEATLSHIVFHLGQCWVCLVIAV